MEEVESELSQETPNEYRFKEEVLHSILDEQANRVPPGEHVNLGRQTGVYDSTSVTYNLIPYEVKVEERRITTRNDFTLIIQRENLEGVGSIGSSILNGVIRAKDVRTFPHDFTFNPITSSTDVRISDILSGVSTPLSNLTPDFMEYFNGNLVVMEFATTQQDSAIRTVLNQKVDKYRIPLREAARQYSIQNNMYLVVHLCVIVVSETRVASTHRLPQSIIDELTYRYRLSYSIQSKALSLMGRDRDLIDDNKEVDMFKTFFKSIPVEDLGGEFSLENYNELMQDLEPQAEEELVKKIIKTAKSQIHEKIQDYEANYQPNKGSDNPNFLDCRMAFMKYLDDYVEQNKQDGLRSDMKSMVQFPFICLRRVSRYDFKSMIDNNAFPRYDEENHLLRFVRTVVMKIASGDIYVPETNEDDTDSLKYLFSEAGVENHNLFETHIMSNPGKYSKKSQHQIENRSKYHRMIVEIEKEDEIEMAKYGIYGKKYSDNHEVKRYRKDKKRFFCPKETDTSDLDKILDNDDLVTELFDKSSSLNETDLDVRGLIFESLSLHTTPEELKNASSEYYLDVMESTLGTYASMISDIGVELAISIKQNCKSHEFIVKKLKNFNLWLIIKPTKSTSHIFFCAFTYDSELCNGLSSSCKPEAMRSVFKTLHRDGSFLYTEFISLNMSKLVNWVLCESRFYSACAFWQNSYGIPVSMGQEISETHKQGLREAQKMTLITLMVNLIDKAEVEEHMSMLRYITLEGLVAAPNKPNPHKMFEKFSMSIKSRFTLWVIRKLATFASHVADGNIKMIIERIEDVATNTLNRKLWTGFMNPYLNQPVSSPQLMINLFYLGYLKNKDEYPENNTLSKLYEKILVIEDELTEEVESRIGKTDKPWGSNTKHEYNISLIKLATKKCVEKFQSSNPGFLLDLENLVLSNLARTGLDPTFTTLKASSSFNSDLFALRSVTTGYHRMKVVEALTKKLNQEDYRLVDVLPEVAEEVFERKYLLIDIFQKNQHGGLREIYVLGLFDRIIQYVIESISRTICTSFPGETMTHPNNKRIIPESHHAKCKQRYSNSYITFGLSADASKWSQNHYAHKFSIMLFRFLPKYMHGFIWQALHLWKDKRIMLNPKLIHILDDSTIEGFYSEPIQKLYDCYHGRINLKWYTHGESFIKTRTGMMQGILHYTSSLLHAVVNEFSKMVMLNWCSVLQDSRGPPEIDMLESSDDSAMLFSLPIDDNSKSLRKAHILAQFAQEIKEIIGREVSIINSIKTTSISLFFYEFNSEFKFGSNHYRPDIKFMISLPLISEQEALIARQEEWSTLLTQYIENGGSTWPVHCGQVSQALIHYRLMGSSVCKEFEDFTFLALHLKDPSQGFFLMDPIISSGLLGFKYNLWNACQKTNLGLLYKEYLFRSTDGSEEKLEVTQSGSLSRTVKLIYGDRRKWLRMLERIGASETWKEEINEDFKMLYIGVKSNADLRRMISLKMHTSGVAESISKGNVISRTIASSVFILTFQCLTRMREWQSEDTGGKPKQSLFDLLTDSIKTISKADRRIDESELRVLFPFHDDFTRIREMIDGLGNISLKPVFKDYRRRITNIEVSTSVKISNLPLKEIVTQVWFPGEKHTIISPRTAMVLFYEHQNTIHWLNKDPKKTIQDSPFDDAVSLYNWISSVSNKDRVVRLLGTPIISHHGKSSLMSAMMLNFQTNFKLERSDDTSRYIETHSIKTVLYMLSRSPFSEQRAVSLMELALEHSEYQIEFQSKNRKSRENTLAIIQKTLAGGTSQEISTMIEDNRMGIIGGFTTRGSPSKRTSLSGPRARYEGTAIWEGLIHGVKVKLVTNSVGLSKDEDYTGVLRRIEISEITHFMYISNDIRTLCKEMKLKIDTYDNVKLGRSTTFGLISSGLSQRFGVPVSKLSKELQFNIEGVSNLRVDIRRNAIRLIADMRDWSQSSVTLLSYVIQESDYYDSDRAIPESFIERIPESIRKQVTLWIRDKPADVRDASCLIEAVSGIFGRPKEELTDEDRHKSKVLREVFVAAMIRLGINQSKDNNQFAIAATRFKPEPEEFDLDELRVEYDPAWEDEFDLNISEEGSMDQEDQEVSTNWDIDMMLGDDAPDLLGLVEFLEDNTRIQLSDASIFRRHKLFDNYAKNILTQFAIPNVSSCFNLARVRESTKSLRSAVAVYVGVSPDSIHVEDSRDEPSSINFNFD
ncbi:RNA-dependent RNA polymerase [Wuhan Fly Virus 1]|uniref:RNA-directed RNA polymerase L n=1 Tax=Wuhan Fly Virus 1 TaxID=1608101 RepID=A0A0B5KFA5_9VIRU|nr:RNA-dependent RNA polymerase [Wuhan Fly Virus 1]AJG39259.1 RNA-dependent RNA polymerase [Wuhan Fly Virus 1]